MSSVVETVEKENDIDFLPAHYRGHTAQRKGRAWRLSTIVLVGLLLPAVSVYQLRMRSQLKRELGNVAAQCLKIDGYRAQLQVLDTQRQQQEARARLIAYLQFPWPRSQILTALLVSLPQSLTLTSIQIEEITVNAVGSASAAKSPHQETQAQAASLLPSDADLKTLRDKHDPAQVTVMLTGLTTDPSQLHEYLGQLSRNRLFVKAELLSLESPLAKRAIAARNDAAQFRAKVIVVPGPGQPGGPQNNERNETHNASVAGRLP